MITRLCNGCKTVKKSSEFWKNCTNRSTGLQSRCIACLKFARSLKPKPPKVWKPRKFRKDRLSEEERRAHHAVAVKKWRSKPENRRKSSASKRAWCQKNRDKQRAANNKWRIRHPDRVRENHLRFKRANPTYSKEYGANRRSSDIAFRIRGNLQRRIVKALKGTSKIETSIRLLGCSPAFLVGYLENLFQSGMTWGNYGLGSGKWNVDHVTPCASFDLNNAGEQRRCFHFTNLQPLWSVDNIRKGNKIAA